MQSGLTLPRSSIIIPKVPSRIKLDMAFGLGSGSTLFDKSRYRSHGTISGASWAAGLHGYALDFNSATPDYVEISAANSTQLNFTSEKFSIIACLKIDVYEQHHAILTRGKISETGWEWRIATTGQIHFRTNQGGVNQVSTSTAGDILAATLYTVGISRNGASVKVFRNGADRTTTSGTHINPLTSSENLRIGTTPNSTLPLDGKIEFLRIFGGIALSASEHLAYHRALA